MLLLKKENRSLMETNLKVAVIGSGTMGSGIAQVAATAGCEVKIFDSNLSALEKSKIISRNHFSKIS